MTDPLASIDPSRAALLVMDYQRGIIERLGEAGDTLVDAMASTLTAARELGVHVGYVRVAFTDDDIAAFPATSSMGARVGSMGLAMHDDSPATAVDERIAPQPGDIVVRKVRVGPFSTTDLAEQLLARGVDTLLLAGISTSGVVLSTVRDAADRDYRVVVVRDRCADPEPDVHEFLVERIFPRQATVVTSAELLAGLGPAPS
jgi:nicotinamidase-related amidase